MLAKVIEGMKYFMDTPRELIRNEMVGLVFDFKKEGYHDLVTTYKGYRFIIPKRKLQVFDGSHFEAENGADQHEERSREIYHRYQRANERGGVL